jgi:hypothetical protein
MIEQKNGDSMNNIEEDLEKLSKRVERLEKKIDLIIEHFQIQITPKEETSKPAEFITGIAEFDM